MRSIKFLVVLAIAGSASIAQAQSNAFMPLEAGTIQPMTNNPAGVTVSPQADGPANRVPEPTSLALLGAVLAGLGLWTNLRK